MRRSRRDLEAALRIQGDRVERLTSDLADARRGERACANQLERSTSELSRAKDVIVSHIAAAGHPSTVLHDARAFADALLHALTDAGINLRAELARVGHTDPVAPPTRTDQDRAITAWETAVEKHTTWEPTEEDAPRVEGGLPRPTHPAVVLYQTQRRCRELEQRLARVEGRARVVDGQ